MGSPAPISTPTRRPIKEETAFIVFVGLAVLVRSLERLLRPLERAAGTKAKHAPAVTAAPTPRSYRVYTAFAAGTVRAAARPIATTNRFTMRF
jgi:hypothetical protein